MIRPMAATITRPTIKRIKCRLFNCLNTFSNDYGIENSQVFTRI